MRVAITPPPGLVNDATEMAAPGVWQAGNNVRFYRGLPQVIGGETTLQSAAVETYDRVSRLLAYRVSGVVHVAVAGDTLWRVNTTTWARTAITPAGWLTVALGTQQYASLDMFGDVLLAVPHHPTTATSHGTLFASVGGAAAAAVANAPDNINAFLVTPSRQVMALGCNEEVSGTYNGRCIRWSDIEDYTDWTTSSSNNAGEYILPGQDDIVGARLIGDHIAVWTKSALFLGQYIGQPGQTFIFTRIDNAGLISRHCHAEFQGAVYWMGPDLFVYAWRPGAVPQKIECPCLAGVWGTMGVAFGKPSAAEQLYFHAFTNHKYGEIWFFYPANGSSGADNYLAFCVNESAQRPVWFTGSMAAGAVLDDPLLVDALNMDDSNTIRVELGTSKVLTAIDKSITTATFPTWSIQSSVYYLDEAKRRVQIQSYIADHYSALSDYKVTLFVKDYPETLSETTKGPYTITTGGGTPTLKSDFRASGRLVSVKFSNSTSPGRWRLGKPVFEAVALGNR